MKRKYLKWAIIGLTILLIDFFLYIFIGLMLLNYEDFYDTTKGEYWSWKSMDSFDRIVYIFWYIWWILNITGILYLAFRIYQFFKQRKTYS